MDPEIREYHAALEPGDREICELLHDQIEKHLKGAESKVWHAHPVWFLDGNPIVGYSRLRSGLRLMFWSGASFEDPLLVPGGKFKDASITYTKVAEVKKGDLRRWLGLAREIQWDYKNIVKRKGVLVRVG